MGIIHYVKRVKILELTVVDEQQNIGTFNFKTTKLIYRTFIITVSQVSHNPYLCFTFGQTHYKTFDGKYFYFPGRCKYNFVEDCDGSDDFAIQVANDPKCSHLTDCTRSVLVYIGETVIKVDNPTS